MAQDIGCDLCGEERAVMMQTNIDSGEVVAVGAACLIPFYLGGARGLAEAMPPEVGQAYWAQVSELATLPAWGDHLPPAPANPRVGTRARPKAAAKTPPVPPEPPAPEAVSDTPDAAEGGAD